MNLIKTFLFVMCLSLFGAANAQNVKPKFKTITVVAYHPVLNGRSGQAVFYVMDYSIRFYQNDSLHYTANNYTPIKPFEEPKKFKFGMSDTAYRISDNLVPGLNNIFNGKTALKSHMITDKLPDGSDGYNDQVYFITYTAHNTSDTFIAVPPFLDKKLKNLLDKINALPRANNWILEKTYHDSDLEEIVKAFEKTCSYIPKPSPPKVSKLEIADPGVKH